LLLSNPNHNCLNPKQEPLSIIEVKLKMVIGEKLWEGKGKSGASFIKSIDMSGVTSMYTWTAQMKGMGKAKGIDCSLNVTGVSMTPDHDYDRRYGHNKGL
jgi:hypothetical protein